METILCIPCCSATSHANCPTMIAHDKGTTPSRLVHFMKTTISRPKTWISLSFRLCEPPVRRQQATAIFRRQPRLSWMRSLAKRLEMSLGLSPRWGRNLFSHFMRFENFLFFLFFPFFVLLKKSLIGITSKTSINSTKQPYYDEEINQFYFYEVGPIAQWSCYTRKVFPVDRLRLRTMILRFLKITVHMALLVSTIQCQ